MGRQSERRIVFRLPIRDDSDVAQARSCVRELCARLEFPPAAVEALATAASEVARNTIVHAHDGEVLLGTARDEPRTGVVIIVRDAGPGISNIDDALRDGYSTGDGLGLGLPSARRLVDEFELHSALGEGTTVTMTMWSTPEAVPRST
jgi:anti-sigma regulatory factor (Ser/Thr protein kinase)